MVINSAYSFISALPLRLHGVVLRQNQLHVRARNKRPFFGDSRSGFSGARCMIFAVDIYSS